MLRLQVKWLPSALAAPLPPPLSETAAVTRVGAEQLRSERGPQVARLQASHLQSLLALYDEVGGRQPELLPLPPAPLLLLSQVGFLPRQSFKSHFLVQSTLDKILHQV